MTHTQLYMDTHPGHEHVVGVRTFAEWDGHGHMDKAGSIVNFSVLHSLPANSLPSSASITPLMAAMPSIHDRDGEEVSLHRGKEK